MECKEEVKKNWNWANDTLELEYGHISKATQSNVGLSMRATWTRRWWEDVSADEMLIDAKV